MPTDGANGIWIRQLQGLLVDLGRATDEEITGAYDDTTAAKIRDFQREQPPARHRGGRSRIPGTFLQAEACNP